MNKKMFTLLAVAFFCCVANAQTVLDGFEDGVTFTANLINHNPADAIVAIDENPNPDAVNATEAVLIFARKTNANFWTGMYGDLTEMAKMKTRNHSRLQVKYYRTSDKSTLRIKINGDNTVGEFDPITPPSKVNEWEVLEFDYAGKGYSEILNLDIRPDWCNEDEVEVGRRAYVDELVLVGEPKSFDGVIGTFEAGVGGFFGVQSENVALEVVPNSWANAVNASANCLKVTRSAAGANWEGVMKNGFAFTVGSGSDAFSFLHFDVRKPIASSIGVIIKNDPAPDEASYTANTLLDEWEHVVVDLSQYAGNKNTVFIQPELTGGAITLYLDNIVLSKDAQMSVSVPSAPLFGVRSITTSGVEVTTDGTGLLELYDAQGVQVDARYVTSTSTLLIPRHKGVAVIRYVGVNGVDSRKIVVR